MVAFSFVFFFFFFFQAEDGIRDYKVTGVQTCALPISRRLLDDRIHAGHERHGSPLGREPRDGLLLWLQSRRTLDALSQWSRTGDAVGGYREPRREPAAGHRPRCRWNHSGDHGRAPAPDRLLAEGERRGDLRHEAVEGHAPVERG